MAPRASRACPGHLEVEGGQTFKDGKLFPGGTREWDWHETGTDHLPYIEPVDANELVEHTVPLIALSYLTTVSLSISGVVWTYVSMVTAMERHF